MKKAILMMSVFMAISHISLAQSKSERKYEKLYYKNNSQDADKYSVEIDNAVSTAGETKFKIKITNKTGDYLIFKPEESKFLIAGKEQKSIEKWLIIKPYGSDFRVINLKGSGYNSTKKYSFNLDGIYFVSADGKPIQAPEFKLPASNNDFKSGDFSTSLSKLSKETDKTEAKFKTTYNGSKIGFIDPSKVAVKMPDGNEYAAKQSSGLLGGSNGPIMLMKGQDDSFTLKWERMQGGKKMDMQKVPMIINWHEAFSESSPIKAKGLILNFEFDEFVSDQKNN